MFTENELKQLSGMGYVLLAPLAERKANERRLSLQDISAHRRYTDLDYTHSYLLFIERGRYRLHTPTSLLSVAEYDVRLIYPWPWDEDGRAHPGMCEMQAGRELGALLGVPYNRKSGHIMLACEPYEIITMLTDYLARPELRISYSTAHS